MEEAGEGSYAMTLVMVGERPRMPMRPDRESFMGLGMERKGVRGSGRVKDGFYWSDSESVQDMVMEERKSKEVGAGDGDGNEGGIMRTVEIDVVSCKTYFTDPARRERGEF